MSKSFLNPTKVQSKDDAIKLARQFFNELGDESQLVINDSTPMTFINTENSVKEKFFYKISE